MKGFYVVSAHWVDVITMKTILDVKCGAGVGVRVGTDLFEYLKRMGRDVVTCILNVTSDNGSDATNAVVRLFQLVNIFVGYEQLRQVQPRQVCRPLCQACGAAGLNAHSPTHRATTRRLGEDAS